MGSVRVHDFRLTSGGERCSLILGGAETYIQVGEVTLTMDQLDELYQRVMEFDETEMEEP